MNEKLMIKLHLEKQDSLSDGSIRLLFKITIAIINFGLKKGYIDKNPIKDLKQPKIDNARQRYLLKSEIVTLYGLISTQPHLNLFVRISLATGARTDAILSLKYKDIDFVNKVIKLKDFKGNETYNSFLTQELLDLLKKDSSPNSYIVSYGKSKFSGDLWNSNITFFLYFGTN